MNYLNRLSAYRRASFRFALLLFALTGYAQTVTTLASFDGTQSGQPLSGVVQALDGNLYGTNFGAGQYPFGSIFKVTSAGSLTEYYFNYGYQPDEAMIMGTDGKLYGTATYGGAYYDGTVFRYDIHTGEVTTIYSFCSAANCVDGRVPNGLVLGADGMFYGTDVTNPGATAAGTVFKITPTGTLTTLYSFCQETNCTNGWMVWAGVVQGSDGKFYGTTVNGGLYNAGTIYKITSGGSFTSLYSFLGGPDGTRPSGLVQTPSGTLYGTTNLYGPNGQGGAIFKVTTGGTLTTLYGFCSLSGCADGSAPDPSSSLLYATDGNLYGTTVAGGTNGDGTIFKVTPTGVLTTLHSFSGSDGTAPEGTLMQGTDGNIYGTTSSGGGGGYGTVYKLTTGLAPFVKTVPTIGRVGANVFILGNQLNGTTSVTFNGTPATFTVVSPGAIRATVPAGATTGTVQVTSTGGALNSNVVFRIH
jgi:uncharacterized repeat protein (TIGR03803 family)